MRSGAVVRVRAAALLADYARRSGETEPVGDPNPRLERLAHRCFRLSVFEDPDLEPGVQGMLDLDADTIHLQPGLSRVRRAFILAHEIGHRALEHPPRQVLDTEAELDEERSLDDAGIRDGVVQAYGERDRWEREANSFAAELLAPVTALRAAVRAEPGWSVASLALRFGVTESLLRTRLAAAFLPGPTPETTPGTVSTGEVRLDPAQQAAVEVETPALVIAGPGAGKTRVLVSRFVRRVEQGVDPRRILALTFSNRAAGEMEERLAAALPEQAHALQVTTFHGLGLQLLQEYGGILGLPQPIRLLTPVDAVLFLHRRIAELPLGGFEDLHRPARHLPTLLGTISRLKDELISPDRLREQAVAWQEAIRVGTVEGDPEELRSACRRALDLAAVYETAQGWMRAAGFLDYGDLIGEAIRLCTLPGVGEQIRSRFDEILVDELQDINYAGGRLVRALDGGRGVVWAVGDPRQSIYRFRGASPANLREFALDYPGARVLFLDRNYRSAPDVVTCGEAAPRPELPPDLAAPPLLATRPSCGSDPAVALLEAPDEHSERFVLVDQVRALLQQGRPPGEVAVLCRTRAQARRMAASLEGAGIATDWKGALDEEPLFQDLMGVLYLAVGDARGVVRLAARPEFALEEPDLTRILRACREQGGVRAALTCARAGELAGLSDHGQEAAARLLELAERLAPTRRPWDALSAYLFEGAGWLRDWLALPESERLRERTVLGQAGALTREFPARADLAGGEGTAEFLEYLALALQAGDLGAADSGGAPADAVSVLTVHRSKGLEWPVVFVPQLADGRFPPRAAEAEIVLPPGLLPPDGGDSLDEERCLFYVAVTRARDRLFLSSAAQYGRRRAEPSPFLAPVCARLREAGRLATGTCPAAPAPVPPASPPRQVAPELGPVVPLGALVAYEQCPRRYLYETVYGVSERDPGYARFHRSLSQCLAWAAEQANDGPGPTAEATLAELEHNWDVEGPGEHPLAPFYRRQAEQVLRGYLTDLKPRPGLRWQVRQFVNVAGRRVEFAVDEWQPGPEPVLRRVHLGRPAKSHGDDHRLALASAAMGEQPHRIRLYYPATGEELDATPSPRKIQNRLKKMGELISGIESGSFPARPDARKCPHCPFQLICDGGRDQA